jgi:predicted O-methyltransferase YrrM
MAQIGNGGHIYTLEMSAPKIEIARAHIAASELQNITLIEGDAEVILKDQILTNIDVLFIDAYRKKYKEFLIMCEPMLNAGAFIIADNITSHPEDVQDFLAYIKGSGKYDSEVVPIGSGLLVATIIAQ